jgi:hypothetical protein
MQEIFKVFSPKMLQNIKKSVILSVVDKLQDQKQEKTYE